ncbi:hypothetical protein ACTD5D_21090 [Nocardia takedensis]|uniref:hypothetical protein n=1 Tax=Nocardia takedensis TaxID=259390 RepID=UPI003F76FCF3
MFPSVLREITSYFDRRTLISTFFPLLIFIGATVLVVSTTHWGVSGALTKWSSRTAVEHGMLLVGFVLLIAFLTFVLTNLREWQDRLTQGYWPPRAHRLAEICRRRLHDERSDLIARDDVLRRREEMLASERLGIPGPDDRAPATLRAEDVPNELAALTEAVSRPRWQPGTSARLAALARTVRADTPDRIEEFSSLVPRLVERLTYAEQQVRDQRAEVQRSLFLLYPQPPSTVAPTRMGNIVRAAEEHPNTRYGMDGVVLWTRLRQVLPTDFAETLGDARTAVNLLLTVAGLLSLLGVPLTWWLMWKLPRIDGAAEWLTVAAAAACVGAYWTHRLWGLLAPATGALVVLHIYAGSEVGWLRGEVGLVWTLALLLTSYGFYRNAAHAMIAYTERLRTAYDLYRWKLLEELRIPLPADLTTERHTWIAVSQLLYRGGVADTGRIIYQHPS